MLIEIVKLLMLMSALLNKELSVTERLITVSLLAVFFYILDI